MKKDKEIGNELLIKLIKVVFFNPIIYLMDANKSIWGVYIIYYIKIRRDKYIYKYAYTKLIHFDWGAFFVEYVIPNGLCYVVKILLS